MEQVKYDIFISYRRVDSEGRTSGRDIARNLQKELTIRGYNVFFDYSEIKDDDFEDIILSAVQNSKVLLLVLSKDALLRCSNDGDWVRREIETAIKSGCKIIPLNPDNAFKTWPENLPDSIRPITGQEISQISMESLFEKSIDKIVEERFTNIFNYKKTSHRLHSLTFMLLFVILGGISCYYCAESMSLLIDLPDFYIWMILIPFFMLLTLNMKYISDSFNPQKRIKHRTLHYFGGLGLSVLYGALCIIPFQTHALYYKFSINEVLKQDLNVTKKYLYSIQKRDPSNRIEEVIVEIEQEERKLAYGLLKTSDKDDIRIVDSILLVGYTIIRDFPNVEYTNIDDEIHYECDVHVTRAKSITNVINVWSNQFTSGFSKEFLLALIISLVVTTLSALSFITAMKD